MNELLSALLKKFDDSERYLGGLLVGSGARGDLTRYSDIDLVFYVDEREPDGEEGYQLRYHDDRLVSLTVKSVSSAEQAFTDPEHAIARIAGLQNCRVLRDSQERTLEKLKARAGQFVWTEELRQRAHRRASYNLAGNAEEVHKILRGLSQKDDGALLNGGWGITLDMPLTIALKEGVLSLGDSVFARQVREAVGTDSRWSRLYAMATGAYPGLPGCSQLALQSIAAFWLFDETASLIDDIVLPEHEAVIDTARTIAKSSGLVPGLDV
jgi:hypothetical protein